MVPVCGALEMPNVRFGRPATPEISGKAGEQGGQGGIGQNVGNGRGRAVQGHGLLNHANAVAVIHVILRMPVIDRLYGSAALVLPAVDNHRSGHSVLKIVVNVSRNDDVFFVPSNRIAQGICRQIRFPLGPYRGIVSVEPRHCNRGIRLIVGDWHWRHLDLGLRPDVVHHLAARQFHNAVPAKEQDAWFAEVNVTGTSNVITMHVSSVGVHQVAVNTIDVQLVQIDKSFRRT